MAFKVNLVIDQGTTFSANVDLQDANGNPLVVSSYSARGQIRKHYQSANSTAFSIALTEGLMTLSLSANQTSSLASGKHVYDIEFVDSSNNVTRAIEGLATVMPETTK